MAGPQGTGKPYQMMIETGKVREFARATKSSHPDYQAPSATAPVTFLMASEFWTRPENAPWGDNPPSFERLLHGEQEFIFPGVPPRVGDQLSGVMRVDKVYTKEGGRGGTMTFIETVTEYRRPDSDDLVAEVRATLIETSKPAS